MTDWAIPQQAKLRYTQLFNSNDKNQTGYLSGVQCRDILIQSGLPRNVLAEIWNLSDIDGDGQLSREEFVLALFLTNHARSGKPLPEELPPNLVPPSYRHPPPPPPPLSSQSSTSSVAAPLPIPDRENQQSSSDANQPPSSAHSVLSNNSFDDKRRENYEKGRAELERRRLIVIEQQSELVKEQSVAIKKQVAELKSKIDSMRSERDAKMGLLTTLEAQIQGLKDKKAYLNLEEQKIITLAKELDLVNSMSQIEIDHEKEQTKKKSIDEMKAKLTKLSEEKTTLTKELEDHSARILELKKDLKILSEKADEVHETFMKKKSQASLESSLLTTQNSNLTSPLKEKSNTVQDPFIPSSENLKTDNSNGSTNATTTYYKAIYTFDARNDDELTLNPGDIITGSNVPQEPGWLSGSLNGKTGLFPEAYVERIDSQLKESGTCEQEPFIPASKDFKTIETLNGASSITATLYRAIYTFDARNDDELTLNPGDIITGSNVPQEPGWLSGTLNEKTGLFPEAYVEKIDSRKESVNDVGKSRSKKPEIATVLADYRALGSEQLNLEKGQLVLVRRKVDSGWWEGELQVKGKKKQYGWFPADYVKLLPASSNSTKAET